MRGKDYNLKADNIMKMATGDITTSAKTATKKSKGDVTIISEQGNVNKNAQKEIQNNSNNKSKLH